MIQVTTDCPQFCNSCLTTNADKNIKAIITKSDNSAGGTAIMLCETCREQLISQLIKADCNNGLRTEINTLNVVAEEIENYAVLVKSKYFSTFYPPLYFSTEEEVAKYITTLQKVGGCEYKIQKIVNLIIE